MPITELLRELLYRYECVTLPQFGAFLTHPVGQAIAGDRFMPPQRQLSFNGLLITNDGILATHLAAAQECSYEAALRAIEKEVSTWRKRLQTQVITLEGIGELRLNPEKKIQFQPASGVNFDPAAFGLSTFHRSPIRTKIVEQPKIIPIMSENENNDFMFTPEQEEENTKTPIWRYALIGVLTVGLLGAGYYFSDQYVTDQKVKNMELAQQKIEQNVQQASFNLGSLAAVELNLNADPAALEEEAAMGIVEPRFSIIAGSYRDYANAERKLSELKSDGFDAAFTELNPEGMHRVAYGRYENKREAINMLYYIRFTLEEEAWYLEEN